MTVISRESGVDGPWHEMFRISHDELKLNIIISSASLARAPNRVVNLLLL